MPREANETEALSELQAKSKRVQEAYSDDHPKSARDAFAAFIRRVESGEASPFRRRMDQGKRFACQRDLVDARGYRYAACSFENYEIKCDEQQRACELLKRYAEEMPERLTETDGGGVVLTGPPGTGKDHLLMALMSSAILDWGFTVRWTDGLRLYQRVKNAITTNRTESEINKYTKPQILAISDPVPPRDELTAYEMACMRQIIDMRYSAGLATWITTNIRNADEAKQKLTPAVLGRLLDQSLEIQCEWEGYRRPSTKHT